MVGDEQVGAPARRLVDDRQGGVEREEDPPHRLVEVAGDEPHPVPVRGIGGRPEAFEDVDDGAEQGCRRRVGRGGFEVLHVGPAGLEPTTPAV